LELINRTYCTKFPRGLRCAIERILWLPPATIHVGIRHGSNRKCRCWVWLHCIVPRRWLHRFPHLASFKSFARTLASHVVASLCGKQGN